MENPQVDGEFAFSARESFASSSSAGHDSTPPRRELANSVRKLMLREVGGVGPRPTRPDATFLSEKFRRIQLQEEFFVLADAGVRPAGKTKSITNITAAKDIIFAIARPGLCAAFHQTRNGSIAPFKRNGQLWYLNRTGELIETLFYNKIKESIIIVSSRTKWRDYQMRAVPLESIRRCDDLDDGVPVFGFGARYWPFFDDCNNIAVVCSPSDEPVYNVYDLNSYGLVHSLDSKNIRSMTIRPGIMIVVHHLTGHYLPIEVLSTAKWSVLKKFNYPLSLGRGLEFTRISNENLLLKQEGENLQIIDIWNHNNVVGIDNTTHTSPLRSFVLNANDILLKFKNDMVVICNSRGKQVVLLEGNELGNYSGGYLLYMYITRDKNMLIMYSGKNVGYPGNEGDSQSQASTIGSIDIRNTFNGKCIAKINPCDDPCLAVAPRKEGAGRRTNIQSSIHEALENVTALFYDEDHNRIFTGNKEGLLHMWSN